MVRCTQGTLLLVGGIDFQGQREPLPGSLDEVTQVHPLAQKHGLTVTLLTGADATKKAVTTSLTHNPTHVIIATHGAVKSSSAFSPLRGTMRGVFPAWKPPISRSDASFRIPLMESGLVLAGGSVLTAEEMVGLDLRRIKLLTLSACRTGLGQETPGQGVLGLQAALLTAGARSLLMSLWDVADDATAQLMDAFYTYLWRDRMPPALALQQA
jgi:CHAT domain-containing protein